MAKKRRKATKPSRKSAFGKVGNWGESSWSDGGRKKSPDSRNKTMAKSFK